MILLKANEGIKKVFHKMINTMGENVKWLDVFVINNNDIILPGKGKSMFFNFDSRLCRSNIVDVPIKIEEAEEIKQEPLLENTLNMILYVFGKWGKIKGLRVETQFEQLNRQINYIFSEIDIEAYLTIDNFRFYQGGIQITYEDVIQIVLDYINSSKEEQEEELNEENSKDKEKLKKEQGEDKNKEDKIGLWHNIKWISNKLKFVEEELNDKEKSTERIGHNFYRVPYKCPLCKEKLYMAVYPLGKEFKIETDQEPVYIVRAYTCNCCNVFYTPLPHTMLIEGEVFELRFEDDRKAYEDYRELLGRRAERISSYNFNEYESDYLQKNHGKTEPFFYSINRKEAVAEKDNIENEDIYNEVKKQTKENKDEESLPAYSTYNQAHNKSDNKSEKQNKSESFHDIKYKEKIKSNTSAETSINEVSDGKPKVIEHQLKEDSLERQKDRSYANVQINKADSITQRKKDAILESDYIEDKNKERGKSENKKTTDISNEIQYEKIKDSKAEQEKENHGISNKIKNSPKSNKLENLAEQLKEGDEELFANNINKLDLDNMQELKQIIIDYKDITPTTKNKQLKIIDEKIYQLKKKKLLEKADIYKGKSYAEIQRFIEQAEGEELRDEDKVPFLESLRKMLALKADIELKNLMLNIPENISKKQYEQYLERMEQYKGVDKSYFKKYLEDKRDQAEKREITAFIKRANAKDRKSWFMLLNSIKEQGYLEKNLKPFAEKIKEKIIEMDKMSLDEICPDPAELSFAEGISIYEKISQSDYLPELKIDLLARIEKRLKKIKLDEYELLVNKLEKDMSKSEKNSTRIHYYNVRSKPKSEENQEEAIIQNALKLLASDFGEYEYPIMILDSSKQEDGSSGFLITEDNLFYSSLFGPGKIDIREINEISLGTGVFQKGIYANKEDGTKTKISSLIELSKPAQFVKTLNSFVEYLKEKPESREVSYLSKEKHDIKCCLRCGNRYSEGDVCPKCGEKSNK